METKSIIKYSRLDGVKDIQPIQARWSFAKALMLEDAAGETTPAALEQLDKAISLLE